MKNQNECHAEMDDACCGRPSLTMYHANAKGTGSAVKFILHPAEGSVEGYLEMRIANQMTVGDRRADNPTYPKFDWDNYREVYLDFNAIAQILQVFRGECESINDGKGIYVKRDDGATTVVNVQHIIEPVCGYMLTFRYHKGEVEDHPRFLMSCSEALGMCEAIAGSMYLVAFGRPLCGHTK